VDHRLSAGRFVIDVFDRANADGDILTGGRACFIVTVRPTEPSAQASSRLCDNWASMAGDPTCRRAEPNTGNDIF